MKSIFIYPPYCYPDSPYMSAPLLTSVLKNAGYDCVSIDLNAIFCEERAFNKDFLIEKLNETKEVLKQIENNTYKYEDTKEKYIIQKNIKKIKSLINKNEQNITVLINNVEDAKSTIKSNLNFYNHNLLNNSIQTLVQLFDLIFNFYFINYLTNEKIGEKLNVLEYFVKNEKLNPFYSFYMEKIKEGFFDNYDNIFISQSFDVQTFATFTLAYLLKKYTNKKICIGGNYISRLINTVKKNQHILHDYFDYILVGLGEETIIPFMKVLENKEKPENISGLVYSKEDEIIQNKPQYYLNDIKKRPLIHFDGINFDNYLTPEIIVSLQISKGCPWGKCTFCVFHEGKRKYQIIPPRYVVNEIKYLNKTFGITKFNFVDECLSPNYYYKLSKLLLNENIKCSYYGFARLEKGFTDKILRTMYAAGFKMIEWGYETPNKRIMEIYNKGVDIEERESILTRASNANIWNHCLTITDVPFETIEEEIEDLKHYKKHQNIFHSRQMTKFILYKNTYLANNYNKLNMTNIKDKGELAVALSYERKDKQDYEENIERIKLQKELFEEYKNKVWRNLIDKYIFLYVCKYGKNACLEIGKSLKPQN